MGDRVRDLLNQLYNESTEYRHLRYRRSPRGRIVRPLWHLRKRRKAKAQLIAQLEGARR